MSLRRIFRRSNTILGLLSFIAIAVIANALKAAPVHADNGMTYTWKDYSTVTITGGDTITDGAAQQFPDLNRAVLNYDQGSPQLNGYEIAGLQGTSYLSINGKQCYFTYEIYVFQDAKQAEITVNKPYQPPSGVFPQGYPGSCAAFPETYSYLDSHFNNIYIEIQGTRPPKGGEVERPEQQTLTVVLNAPDPQTTAPKTDNIYVYTTDGKTRLMQMLLTLTSQSGQAQWPPDQTPMGGLVTFQGLQPGDYVVCDDYVDKACSSDKAKDEQKIHKVKFQSASTTIGTGFLTPDKKRIRGHIEYHLKVPCGSDVSVSPMQIELTGPDGKVYDQETNGGVAHATGAENGAICDKDVTLGLYAQWEDMPPGDYTACATGADQCVKVTKPADAGVDDFTLIVNGDLHAPPDEKVCTSGDGVAGALAWIICPAVQLIATATDFFENNIIIPFMTTSPLTTNNDNPIYLLWQDFRDIANVGFVVLLFVSIFSIALSKYGLQRVLPRLLIVIVGINLSYFVIAFIADAFNIFGGGISQLVLSALHQANATQLASGTSASPIQSIFVLGGTALLTIVLTGGAALGWLFSFLGLAALVLVVVVLVLIVRQIAIITLVVLSPIGILLYLLPNTEDASKKFWKTLTQLFVMYPMIVLLFATGKILGLILQQPDFKIAGDGVSDEVAQSVRVILQFLVYIIPLALLPATFAASGGLMGRAYGAFHKRAIQPRTQRLREDAAHMAGEAKTRLATSRIPGVNSLAGRSLRRDYTRKARQQNLQREQEEYLAGAVGSSAWMRRQAAGVSGQAGQTRAAGTAARTAEKGRSEDIDAEKSLLTQEMRRIGMDEDTFAEKTAAYLENPSNPANRVITGSNGETFDFAANETRLQRALLDSAASQGYVRAIEAARMSSSDEGYQSMVDDIIRRNDGELKSKGGYHLATDFNLAAGRIKVHDPATGTMRAPANRDEMEAEITAQRMVAMAKTGANSIADMKAGLLSDSGTFLMTPGTQRDAVLDIMNHISAEDTVKARASAPTAAAVDYRSMLRGKMNMILDPRAAQTLNRSDADRKDFENIRDGTI